MLTIFIHTKIRLYLTYPVFYFLSNPDAYSTQKLTNAAVRQKRVEMFENEMRRQVALVTRIEKIKVEYEGLPEKCTLIMNKGLSTPFNCAMRTATFFLTWHVFLYSHNLNFTR